jgi:hypothetical protein
MSILPERKENQNSSSNEANKNKRYWKAARFIALFGIIEAVSLVLWAKSEDFVPPAAYYIRWFGYCGLLAGGAFLTHKLTVGKFKKQIVKGIWIAWAMMCIVLLLTRSIELKPHFVLSLEIGDSSTSPLFLTNDFLFRRRMVKVGDLPNGSIVVKNFVSGCLVIPVQSGESNKVFNFIAENDSVIKVTDLEAGVGFPKEWECGFDPKWHKSEWFLTIPGWKFKATNMQYVAAQSPWVLFPHDSLNFPSITNPCTPEYIGSTFKGGLVELCIRSTGFEDVLAANICFIPASSNFSKPFVTLGEIGPDGLLRLLTSQEELEKSQK